MTLFRIVTLLVALGSVLAPPAFAQIPGEPKPPHSYDPVGSMQYTFQRWAPSETVREAQQALRDKGYYGGPLDGVLTPQFTRAIRNFQRAKGLSRTARLDGPTMAALDLPAAGAASPRASDGFGAPSAFPRLQEGQAP